MQIINSMKRLAIFLLIFKMLSLVYGKEKECEKSEYCNLPKNACYIKDYKNTRTINIKTSCGFISDSATKSYKFITEKDPFDFNTNASDSSVKFIVKINNKPFTGKIYWTNNINTSEYITVVTLRNSIAYKHEITLIENSFYLFKDQGSRLKKPVLYLYPTIKTPVKVEVKLSTHTMIHPYPAYENGWNVIANKDGSLLNVKTNKEHYCLFWETTGKPIIEKLTKGFVIRGNETEHFLEETLIQLGLNEKEANEFIIFWLPQIQNNPYNAIYFATDEYEKESHLLITPKPDVQIRIMMVCKPLQQKIELEKQILPVKPVRKGFVAVEWSGTII